MMKIIIGLFIICLLVLPVSAVNVTYSDEYYSFKNELSKLNLHDFILQTSFGNVNWEKAKFMELRRQSILLEKQNELIAESNHIAWINTCYVPHEMNSGFTTKYNSNISSLKIECEKAGYPTFTDEDDYGT